MSKYSKLFEKGGLSLDRLRTLVDIADAGSMTRAAKGEPSQMAKFSHQMKELEAFFGAKLAERRGRSLHLNENGRRLVLIVREALENLSGFAGACSDQPRELVIGAGNSMIEWWLVPRLASLRAALPRTTFSLVNSRTADSIQRLREMTLDIGIVRKDAVTAPLKSRALFQLEYRLFVPEEFARGVTAQNVTKKLGEMPLATASGGQFRDELRASAEKAGVVFNVVIACTSFTQAARAVSTGTAAAILPEIAESEFQGMPVESFRLGFLSSYTRPLYIAWHPRREDSHPDLLRAVQRLISS